MPQFVTISPTHVPGKKEFAWNNFRDGGYIAIGWMDEDLTGKTIEQVISIIRKHKFDNENSAIDAFTKLLSLKIGDYVAVNNTNDGLFSVGVIDSGYQYKSKLHDCGDPEEFYPHFLRVKWTMTNYVKRSDIIEKSETGWQPYGTMGYIHPEIPLYIRRLLGEKPQPATPYPTLEVPEFLHPIIQTIKVLRKDPNHQERAHESLVEDFFVSLGYNKHSEIKYRQGRIDLSLWNGAMPLVVVEVKKEWDINPYKSVAAIKQAYSYALDLGCRLVIVTNGDDYLLFDRIKGLSVDTNMIGQFRISAITEDDILLINRLKPSNLRSSNIQEALKFISESFGPPGG